MQRGEIAAESGRDIRVNLTPPDAGGNGFTGGSHGARNAMSDNGTGTLFAALLGRKVGMTRVYDDKGTVIPVTVVLAGPCIVTQVKTAEGKDGYNAVQIGFEEIK